jgi:4-amino-4-deoxy-L-arabinose transferase-like glycosyltransferase
MKRPLPRISSTAAALLLAGAIGVFFLATTRRGLPWMDDYAQYLMHAINIARGRPYAVPGYIYNPAYPYTGPAVYPPVFPLVLAPIYRLFGLDLRVMKGLLITAFCGFVFLIFLLFRRRLGGRAALAAAALTGLNPVFWDFKDNLYPDFLFLFFAFCAMHVFDKARDREKAGARWLPAALASGLLLYLAYGTRTVGALLAAAFLAADLARGRGRPSRTLLCSGAAALACALAQNALVPSGAGYLVEALSWLNGLPLRVMVLGNAATYSGLLASLFDNAYFPPAAWALCAASALLAAAGYYARAREEFGVPEAYTALNLAFLLFCPLTDGARYGFPLIPLLAYYAFLGWRALAARLKPPGRAWAVLLPALVALSYAGVYWRAPYGGLRGGATGPQARELFAFISARTAPGDVVVFRKPRSLLFFTGRSSSMYYFPREDAGLFAYFKKINAAYLVSGPFEEDRLYLEPFIARNPGRFIPLFSNRDFRVYRLAAPAAGT